MELIASVLQQNLGVLCKIPWTIFLKVLDMVFKLVHPVMNAFLHVLFSQHQVVIEAVGVVQDWLEDSPTIEIQHGFLEVCEAKYSSFGEE